MVSFLRKLKHLVPDKPFFKINVVSGSVSFSDWFFAIKILFSLKNYENYKSIHTYEKLFAKITNNKNAFSFGAGRMAAYAILEAIGVGKGDEVIIPAFTCVVIPNAIIYRGAKPIYVDIDPVMFNIDVSKIESAITPKTKVIFAQHTFGIPCDIKKINEIAKKYGLYVVEDCAHALGSFTKNKLIGSLADAAFFSTDRTKVISTHVGGMAVTNNLKIAEKLKSIQNKTTFLPKYLYRKILITFIIEYILFLPFIFWLGKVVQKVLIKTNTLFYFDDELCIKKPNFYPCMISAAQAEIGIRQLTNIKNNKIDRNKIKNYLEKNINWNSNNLEEIKNANLLRYSFLVRNRNEFEKKFSNHFDLSTWYTSVVQGRDRDLKLVFYETGSCPIAEKITKHIVNFPTHSKVSLQLLTKEFNEKLKWLKNEIIR